MHDVAMSYEKAWRLAKLCYRMAEASSSTETADEYARRGIYYSKVAVTRDPDRVEGHYYMALNLGVFAEHAAQLRLVNPMVLAATRAVQIDETYDEAGALVFLGKLYLSAPAWPLSVGDVDRAVSYLERALSLSPTTLTRLFLGQAYYEQGDMALAKTLLEQALSDPRARDLDEKWQREARSYLQRIQP